MSRVRRVECGAVLLPVSSVAVSSAAVVRHAWAARCRLSGGLATSSLSLRLLHASYNRTHRLLRSQPHVRVGCRRWPRHQPSRPCLQRFAHSSHMAAALSAAVALRAPHFAPRHPSPSLSSAGCLRFAFASCSSASGPGVRTAGTPRSGHAPPSTPPSGVESVNADSVCLCSCPVVAAAARGTESRSGRCKVRT